MAFFIHDLDKKLNIYLPIFDAFNLMNTFMLYYIFIC